MRDPSQFPRFTDDELTQRHAKVHALVTLATPCLYDRRVLAGPVE